MALIKCPECGRENVSDSAASCPSCGYNIAKHMERQSQSEIVLKHKDSVNDINNTLTKDDKQKTKTKGKKKYIVILLIVVILLSMTLIICNSIKQRQKQEDIISAQKSFDKLINIVYELFDAKHYTWNIYDDVEANVEDLKKYVSEIDEIYNNYDLEICHGIDDYIEGKTLIGSWHDYTVMLNNEYYLFSDQKEAISKIIDYVPSSKSEAYFEIRLSNFDKVKIGMTQSEVIALIGKPTEVCMSEGEEKYCYGNTIAVWFDRYGLVKKFAEDL